jgi:hypothetical protein
MADEQPVPTMEAWVSAGKKPCDHPSQNAEAKQREKKAQ